MGKNSLIQKFDKPILIITKRSGPIKSGGIVKVQNKPFVNFENIISKHSTI